MNEWDARRQTESLEAMEKVSHSIDQHLGSIGDAIRELTNVVESLSDSFYEFTHKDDA